MPEIIKSDSGVAAWGFARSAISNPVLEILIGFLAVEYFQRHAFPWEYPDWVPGFFRTPALSAKAGSIAEVGILCAVFAQQVGGDNLMKMLQTMAESGTRIVTAPFTAIGDIAKLAPIAGAL